jgi:hypothetical protein
MLAVSLVAIGAATVAPVQAQDAPAAAVSAQQSRGPGVLDAGPQDGAGRTEPAPSPLPSTAPPAANDTRLSEMLHGLRPVDGSSPAAPHDATVSPDRRAGGGIRWGPLLKQSFALLAVQQAYRVAFEDGTWEETKRGIFWDDYFESAKTLCCWDDGDKGTTNYLFHPLMGSAAAFVFANNHEDSQRTPLGNTRKYWSNKTKAMAYSAAYSAYFEVGPVLSESAIGNVGLTPGQQTWVDFVVTPTMGTAISVGEDLLRVHVIDKVDRRSHAWGITLALLLNPTRSVANAFAGKAPWSAPPALSRRTNPRAP